MIFFPALTVALAASVAATPFPGAIGLTRRQTCGSTCVCVQTDRSVAPIRTSLCCPASGGNLTCNDVRHCPIAPDTHAWGFKQTCHAMLHAMGLTLAAFALAPCPRRGRSAAVLALTRAR